MPLPLWDKLRNPDWAYLAGLIDGEGSISVIKSGPRKDPELRLCISTTHYPLAWWVSTHFGARLVTRKDIPLRYPNRKTKYELKWVNRAAINILLKTEKRLIVKRSRAALGISFPCTTSGRKLKPFEVSKKARIYEAMRLL